MMGSFDKPDIDEVQIHRHDGSTLRIVPLEIYFDSPITKTSGEWKLKAYDTEQDQDVEIPMTDIQFWRPA